MLDGVDTYDMLGGMTKFAEKSFPVTVKFAEGVPVDAQGPALLAFEKHLRALTGLDVRVLKDLKGDDSKLRVMMSPAQREKL